MDKKLISHDYYKSVERKKALLKRMNKAFSMKIKTAEQTLERIEDMKKSL